jgi:hypothetical protein
MIEYLFIFVLLIIIIWLSYEIYRAPYMDDYGNIIKKDKHGNK